MVVRDERVLLVSRHPGTVAKSTCSASEGLGLNLHQLLPSPQPGISHTTLCASVSLQGLLEGLDKTSVAMCVPSASLSSS